jgi:hypothetical protein
MRKALTLAICFGLSTGLVWADSFLMGGATRVQHNKSALIFVATKSTKEVEQEVLYHRAPVYRAAIDLVPPADQDRRLLLRHT